MKRLVIVLAACASAPHPAPKPAAPDPEQLAADRHRDLDALAEVAHRTLGNCDALVAELRPLIVRMRAHVDQIHHADPRQMTTALHAYDAQDRGLDDQIGKDLAETYLGCKPNTAVLDVIDQIPAE